MKSTAAEAGIAVNWWRRLQPNNPDGTRNPVSDRVALARLRRADLLTAMSDPATFELFAELGRSHPDQLPQVGLCAAVLAGVREELKPPRHYEHPARTLGPPTIDQVDQAAMKPLRFRRLIEAEDLEERLILLRRAVQLADRRLNVRELAAACLDWFDGRRRRWIFEYYAAGRAAPDTDAMSSVEEPAI
jgi:CRISPR system Cascade subunit CasB